MLRHVVDAFMQATTKAQIENMPEEEKRKQGPQGLRPIDVLPPSALFSSSRGEM